MTDRIPTEHAATAADFLRRVSELPLAAWTVIGVMLISGLILWLVGARFLKGSLVLLGSAAGCFAGSLVPGQLGMSTDPIFTAAMGLLLGAVVGWMSFRYAAGILLAIVLGIAAPLVVLATNPLTHALGEPSSDAGLFSTPALDEADQLLGSSPGEDEPAIDPETRSLPLGARSPNPARDVLVRINESLRPVWRSIPPDGRSPLLLISIAGGIVGFGMGLILPRRGAALGSAIIGSALWLPALPAIAELQQWPVPDALLDNSAIWVGIWAGIALLGTAIQWTARKPKADKSEQQTNP